MTAAALVVYMVGLGCGVLIGLAIAAETRHNRRHDDAAARYLARRNGRVPR